MVFFLFCGGALISITICKRSSKYTIKNSIEKYTNDIIINNKALVALLSIGVVLITIVSIKVVILLLHGTKYHTIRALYYSYGEGSLISSEQLFTIFDWYMSMIITLATPTIIIGLLKKKISKIAVIEYCVMSVLYIFATSGRFPIFLMAIELVLTLFWYRDEISSKIKKKFFVVILVLAVGIGGMTIVRAQANQNKKLNSLYTYFSLPLPYFSKLVNYVDQNDINTYGAATGYGPYLMIQKGIKIITGYKLNNAEKLAEIVTKPQTYWVRIFMDSKDYFNAYSTMFYNFYLDFKEVGVIIFSFIYGALIEMVYLNCKRNKTMKNIVIYMMLIIGVIQSFAVWQFASPTILIALVLTNFIFKKERIE